MILNFIHRKDVHYFLCQECFLVGQKSPFGHIWNNFSCGVNIRTHVWFKDASSGYRCCHYFCVKGACYQRMNICNKCKEQGSKLNCKKFSHRLRLSVTCFLANSTWEQKGNEVLSWGTWNQLMSLPNCMNTCLERSFSIILAFSLELLTHFEHIWEWSIDLSGSIWKGKKKA